MTMGNMENVHDSKQDRLNRLQASFEAVLAQEELFSKIIDFFPYPIEVFARDGTAVMVNRALLAEFGVPSKDMIIGRYNIFEDPAIERLGFSDLVKEVFNGQTRTVTNIKVPLKSIRERYRIENLDIDSIYQDATGFPIKDEQGEVSHVAVLLITKRIYKGKVSIANAIEYLENNWDKEFNLNEAAKAAGLSPYHFSRVFKSDVGMTPHNYYRKLKLEHLMEKLRDTNLTVKEAFDACGLEYNGHSFSVFKKHVGVTPLKYREMTIK
ncbi:MAG: helix-turn-helix domain-containing protein [Bacillota bacterium]|jgi:AraC family transcriptional regulator